MLYKAAIIGCGNIAGGYDREVPREWSLTHAGAYHLCPYTKLVAVADPDPEKLKSFQKKWNVEQGYADYKQLLRNESIDILSLCLPTEHHFAAFTAAVEHDLKAIFCEKPLSHDLEQARQMNALAQERLVTVNYFRRFNPSLARIKSQIKNGRLGRTIRITARYTKGLLGNASHLIDLCRWFWGEPTQAKVICIAEGPGNDPGLDFSLHFDDGSVAYFLHVPNVNYVFIDVDILLEHGRIVIGQRGQQIYTEEIANDVNYGFQKLTRSQRKETDWKNCTTRAVCELIRCLEKEGKPSCTVKDGLRAIEICTELLAQKIDPNCHMHIVTRIGR